MQNLKGPGYRTGGPLNQKSWAHDETNTCPDLPRRCCSFLGRCHRLQFSRGCKVPTARAEGWLRRSVVELEGGDRCRAEAVITRSADKCGGFLPGFASVLYSTRSLQDLLSAEPGWEEALGPAPEGGTA